jgi:fructose-bisphosphate aldolase class II
MIPPPQTSTKLHTANMQSALITSTTANKFWGGRGCIDSQAPFIIQLSTGARQFADKRMLEALIQTAKGIWPEAIFAVHLDHGDEDTCYDCIESGFYSWVMIDASHEPFEGNVEITKRVVERRTPKG